MFINQLQFQTYLFRKQKILKNIVVEIFLKDSLPNIGYTGIYIHSWSLQRFNQDY